MQFYCVLWIYSQLSMEIVTCPGNYLCSATGLKWCCARYDRILKCFRLKIFIQISTKIQVLTCLNDMQPLPLLQLVKNSQFFVHGNLCLTHKQTQMKMRILSLVSVQLWVICSGFWWNKRKLLGASHIVHTWDGSGPFAHLFLWVFSLWSWWNSHTKLQSGIRWFWPQENTCERRSQTLAAPEDTNIFC